MVELEKVWILVKTANVKWAGTNANLQIDVTTNTTIATFRFTGLGPEALSEGRWYELECDIEEYQIDSRNVLPSRIRITVTSDDAWLPEKFWLIGKTKDGEFHILGAVLNWPENSWFSTDLSEGLASYSLDHNRGLS